MSSDREEDHRSVLATIGQLRESLVLSARDEEAAQAFAWHEFNVWALANGRQSLPAEPRQSPSTSAAWQLTAGPWPPSSRPAPPSPHAHAAEGTAKGDNPASHPVVAETVKGWRNQAPAPRQASALTAEALARIRETAQLAKGTPLKELDHRRGVAIPGERTHLSETKRANFRSRDYQGPKTVKLETGVEECFA